jgi:signal transduction histidine kinase/CheY-like chemotaxis protein
MSHPRDRLDATAADPTRHRQEQILVEKVNLLQRHLPVAIVGGLMAFSIMTYWLWDKFPGPILGGLYAIMLVISLLRVVQLIRVRRSPTRIENFRRRSFNLTLLSTLSGTTWGILGFVAVTQADPVTSLIMIMVLTGMVASATASLAHLPLPYYLFILPAMMPAALKFFSFDDTSFFLVGLLILLYLVVSVQFSRDIRQSALQAINLKFDNLNLIERLTAEKKRAEDAAAMAERSNESKSKFLAAASHDLRQPLQALRLLAATLKIQKQNASNSDATVDSINNSVHALKDLFDSLLDISRLDSGTIDLQIEHFALRDLLNRIRPDFKALADEKQLQYTCADTEVIIATDRVLLERVARNLIHNAIRYTALGGVTVSVIEKTDTIELRVSDTGQGIAEGETNDIFDVFVQLDNPERDRTKGLGLGLSIVRRIVNLLDLELDLQSTPGVGTTVTVAIPRGESRHIVAASTRAANIPGDLNGLFVLIIDDEQAVRLALQGLLAQWGCTILGTHSADDALQSLQAYEYEPDIILADYRLRESKTGSEAIEQIRRHYQRRIPAVIITGDVAANRLIELDKLGEPVMHKPCDPAILYGYLNAAHTQT